MNFCEMIFAKKMRMHNKIFRKYSILFILFSVSGLALAQQRAAGGISKTLYDAFGYPYKVTDVVDLNIPMTPEKFWALIQPSRKPGKSINPWTNQLVKDYFFGRYWTHEGGFYSKEQDPVKSSEYLLALPHANGMLGEEADTSRPLIVADDIPFHPVMRSWFKYSSRYYPRRMHDWTVGSFQPAFLLTGKKVYMDRIREMLAFLLYSQYAPDGQNQFVKDFFPQDHIELLGNGQALRWRGGWDYLFDWEWLDGYGYQWRLHEPDHHVGANIALAMLQGWQLDSDIKYLKSAEEFLNYQIPQYGFHSGVWNGNKYYWTQYGRTGSPKSGTSATDNIQALVARTVAMMGYYKKDPVLLEYARGLLWYEVRELKSDGRWYYDGAENPMNHRRFRSHEGVVLNDALTALVYLMKAGMPVDEFIEPFGKALIWCRENMDTLIPEKDFQVWKTFTGENSVIFIQATTNSLCKISLGTSAPLTQSVSKIVANLNGWKEVPASLSDTLQRGEIIKIRYAGVDVRPAVISAALTDYGIVKKASRVLLPDLLINADNFPSFPERIHFPDLPDNKLNK
jgi:hypothetical protein